MVSENVSSSFTSPDKNTVLKYIDAKITPSGLNVRILYSERQQDALRI